MATPNTEILDAAQLVFTDEEFNSLGDGELEDLNSPDRVDDESRFFSGSLRVITVYDPMSTCNVDAYEFFGLGENTPGDEEAIHALVLEWDDDETANCAIDLDTGNVFIEREWIDLSKNPAWKARILGALSMFADKRVGF